MARNNSAVRLSGVINGGDLLWCDFGVVAMGLATDTQHIAYVLKEDETDAPQGLKNALKVGNNLQDIVLRNLIVGKTGNEIFESAKSEMVSQGINGNIYCHPIGDYGHSAGPLIGMSDHQNAIPRGNIPVRNATWFSIELNVIVPIPEWNNAAITLSMEEDVYLHGAPQWVYGRQTDIHLIQTPQSKTGGKTTLIVIGILVPAIIIAIIAAVIYIYKRNVSLMKYEKVATNDEELENDKM